MGEDGTIFLTLRNQTDKKRVRIKEQFVIGKAGRPTFGSNSVSMQTIVKL